jgi:hypothetical protein
MVGTFALVAVLGRELAGAVEVFGLADDAV